jgi:hypothetical protein
MVVSAIGTLTSSLIATPTATVMDEAEFLVIPNPESIPLPWANISNLCICQAIAANESPWVGNKSDTAI